MDRDEQLAASGFVRLSRSQYITPRCASKQQTGLSSWINLHASWRVEMRRQQRR
jgi:hypothetical protein